MAPCFMANLNGDQAVTLDKFFKSEKSVVEVCAECGFMISPQTCGLNGTETKPWLKSCKQAVSRGEMKARGLVNDGRRQ